MYPRSSEIIPCIWDLLRWFQVSEIFWDDSMHPTSSEMIPGIPDLLRRFPTSEISLEDSIYLRSSRMIPYIRDLLRWFQNYEWDWTNHISIRWLFEIYNNFPLVLLLKRLEICARPKHTLTYTPFQSIRRIQGKNDFCTQNTLNMWWNDLKCKLEVMKIKQCVY